jgi:hypothetical protein
MSRYSTAEVESIVKQIEVEAKQVGLIPMDAFVTYHPGSTSNGITAALDCFTQGEDGYKHHRMDFLPEFTYKMTRTDHALLLRAALNVFQSLRRLRERAEPDSFYKKF